MRLVRSYRKYIIAANILLIIAIVGGLLSFLRRTEASDIAVVKAKEYVNIPEEAVLEKAFMYYDKIRGKEIWRISWLAGGCRILVQLDAQAYRLELYSAHDLVKGGVKISLDEALSRSQTFLTRILPKLGIIEGELNMTEARLISYPNAEGAEYLFTWIRVVDGYRVTNEWIRVYVEAYTGDIGAFSKSWWGEGPRNTEVKITKDEAINIAMDKLKEIYGASKLQNVTIERVELAYIYSEPIMKEGGMLEGLWLCWIIKFIENVRHPGSWTEIYIQATTNQIIYIMSCK